MSENGRRRTSKICTGLERTQVVSRLCSIPAFSNVNNAGQRPASEANPTLWKCMQTMQKNNTLFTSWKRFLQIQILGLLGHVSLIPTLSSNSTSAMQRLTWLGFKNKCCLCRFVIFSKDWWLLHAHIPLVKSLFEIVIQYLNSYL